jgi:hypothetical protein
MTGWKYVGAITVIGALLTAGPAQAQEFEKNAPPPGTSLVLPAELFGATQLGRAPSSDLLRVMDGVTLASAQTTTPGGSKAARVWKRIAGGAVGGVGGFFAGGYLGAWIEGDRCHCDDPGLAGAIVVAPIGAVVGAVLGALYLF